MAGLVYVLVVYPREAGPGEGRTVELAIEADMSARELADELEAEGVVRDAWLFSLYLRLLGADRALRVDQRVTLADDLPPAEVARRVARGLGPRSINVTIPEGFTRFDVADRLEHFGLMQADVFVAATADPAILRQLEIPGETAEGYLFPDTYTLRDDLTPTEMMSRMVRSYRSRTRQLERRYADRLVELQEQLGFGMHQVLTLASVVEREAAVPDERPIIAGVFLNRLRSETFLPRQRLQADPTVSYGCRAEPARAPSCSGYRGRITRAMLQDPANRYNSYRHAGLPPTPICNPGLAAIEAVLAPAQHNYLYFVARGGRRHHFSATLERHNEAVDDYLRSNE
ncbi:MAG: endolytic transglycosylase MltG [Sandaracinaceae bacterium]|nr:endolytic transglycosylase MltG [Sandaracinaceae bacterium]